MHAIRLSDLESMGATEARITYASLSAGELSLAFRSRDGAAPVSWQYLGRVCLSDDEGHVLFVGSVVSLISGIQGGVITYTASVMDDWWLLEQTTFARIFDPDSKVIVDPPSEHIGDADSCLSGQRLWVTAGRVGTGSCSKLNTVLAMLLNRVQRQPEKPLSWSLPATDSDIIPFVSDGSQSVAQLVKEALKWRPDISSCSIPSLSPSRRATISGLRSWPSLVNTTTRLCPPAAISGRRARSSTRFQLTQIPPRRIIMIRRRERSTTFSARCERKYHSRHARRPRQTRTECSRGDFIPTRARTRNC